MNHDSFLMNETEKDNKYFNVRPVAQVIADGSKAKTTQEDHRDLRA